MKTAEEIISQINKLPPGEVKKVADYMLSMYQTELTPGEVAECDRRQAEADRGENISPAFSNAKDAIDWLNSPDSAT